MRRRREDAKPRQYSIKNQIYKMLALVFILMLLIIGTLVGTLIAISRHYNDALNNANIAADFNKDFKETLDLEMYNFCILPKEDRVEQNLPMDELNNAVRVLYRLDQTTTISDNHWLITGMLNMCDNLRTYMIEIANTPGYDDRMLLLERNIRGETGLTVLIEDYMHDYMDTEVRQLADLRGEIRNQVLFVVVGTIAGVLELLSIAFLFSVRLTKRITEPISALAKKAVDLGDGNFLTNPLETQTTELQVLDDGFNEMIRRINSLMDKQILDQKTLHRAELELLQAQINPHFLYNTLDSIVILAQSERNEDVVRMVTSLSVFFRNSLSKGQDIITLGAERDQVASYLVIQQIRYSDILQYDIEIAHDVLDCMVPKLILQPLVENALYHGTKNKRGVGHIRILGRKQKEDVLLQVIDDGVGMAKDQVDALLTGIYEDKHTGLGLVNVHKRIKLYCGEAYGLSFESVQGVGTTVSVLLPYQT
ncbi:MAG: sensor histidine kinase [Clostridium sp.]|nr:sensor histidine kinase [Clostridium sp.]